MPPTQAAHTGLPIEDAIPDIRAALSRTGRAVLTAEPGAGKTTVVPLRLLDEPWLEGRRIVMLEPRRLAARAAATRMASLLGERVGGRVGVTTRDDRRVSEATRIEVVTEGVLTRRLQNDPSLEGVGLVVFDEFHERNQQGDLGLALLLDAVSQLELDLRILVMSATIDANAVASLLGDVAAPVVQCPGRTFDVAMHWRPRNKRDHLEPAVVDAVLWALTEVVSGDLLVFLPGMAEIRRVEQGLAGKIDASVSVHPLHGSLPPGEQDQAISPSTPGRRKVVLSTDISESSLTVEGVTVVIDSGLARSPRFDASTGITRLTTVSISRASADQRAGRAGRLGPGTAVRLWSKIEHGTRKAWTPAEITTVDLASFRLELAAWGTKDTTELALLDQPTPRSWADSGDVLAMLGAIDGDGTITSWGRELNRLPLHPRLGAVVLAGRNHNLGYMACVAAALVDERDVLRGRPSELPSDLALRVGLVTDSTRRHGQASGRSIARVRDRARDLARRVGISGDRIDLNRLGLVMSAGFPDRIGQRRGRGRARFLLRSGTGVRVADHDELADASFVVAVEVTGPKKDGHMRLGVAVDVEDLLQTTGFDTEVTERLIWDRDRNDAAIVVERRLGSLDLGRSVRRPPPSDEVTQLLLQHVRDTKLEALNWTVASRGLQNRVEWIRRHVDDMQWPDVSNRALLADLDTWLAPFLPGATGRADLEIVSVAVALDAYLGYDRRTALDRLVPTELTMPNGHRRTIDYSGELAVVSSRAQDFFGLTTHPTVLDGAIPLTLELLSPAGRPVQRTADLPGFWDGSWSEVRKDMAGRYPKHHWPVDPSTG